MQERARLTYRLANGEEKGGQDDNWHNKSDLLGGFDCADFLARARCGRPDT